MAGAGATAAVGTTRAGLDAGRGRSTGGAGGRQTRNSEPAPSLLSTSMRPPIALTMPWQIARPRPVPRPLRRAE